MTHTWYAHTRNRDWTCTAPSRDAIAFHQSLPGYAPTPLISLPTIAAQLGVGHVFAKDESQRLGLPAFKALGASWAIHRALQDAPADQQMTIVTATDGNHGRAVAKFSAMFGHKARIYTPAGVHPSAIQAIRDEGADVIELDGSYDDAVAAAGSFAGLPSERRCDSGRMPVGLPIDDAPAPATALVHRFADCGIRVVESVQVTVQADHPYGADLQIELTSPADSRSLLARPHFCSTDLQGPCGELSSGWTFHSVRHMGEAAGGPEAEGDAAFSAGGGVSGGDPLGAGD